MLRYQGRLCIPDVDGLKNQILEKEHGSRYTIHPGLTKMYHVLRDIYWWEGLKWDIAVFIAKCPNFQQVKAKHLNSGSLQQEIQIPTSNREYINMEL